MRGRTGEGDDVRPRGRRRSARQWCVLPAALVALLAVVSAGALVGAPPASAIGNGKFSIAPLGTSPSDSSAFRRSVFTPVLSPGVPAHDSVVVANLTRTPLTLDLYASDAYTTSNGGFAIEPNFRPKLHMGAWIDLAVPTLTIAPRSADIVPFTYLPPANVASGDYAGGIVAVESKGTFSKKGPVRVQVLQAVGVAVYGRVPGPLHPRLAVTAVSLTTTRPFASQFGGPVDATVTYSVTNTGNENLKPVVTVALSPLIGSGPKFHVQMPEILPGSTVTFRHTFDDIIPYVVLRATVTAHALGVQGLGSTTAVVIPWALVAIVVLLIVLALYYRRRRRSRPGSQTGREQPGDTSPGSGGATRAAPVKTGTGAHGP